MIHLKHININLLHEKRQIFTNIKAHLGLLLLFVLIPHASFAEDTKEVAKPENKVLAEINTKKLTNNDVNLELQRRLGSQLSSLSSTPGGEEQIKVLRKRILDKMIERELLVQAAAKLKLQPSESEVSDVIEKIKSNSGTKEQWVATLAQHKIDEATFRQGIIGDLTIQSYIEKQIYKDISVSDEELRSTFDANPSKYASPEEVHARHILLKVAEGAKEEDVKKVKERAESVLKEAKKDPASFATLAEKHSEGPTKTKGGDLGYFSKNQMVKPFADSAFSLKVGAVSDLVKTRFGFHIIKVEDKRGGGVPKFEEASEKIKQGLLRTRRTEQLTKRLEELRKQAKIVTHLTEDGDS